MYLVILELKPSLYPYTHTAPAPAHLEAVTEDAVPLKVSHTVQISIVDMAAIVSKLVESHLSTLFAVRSFFKRGATLWVVVHVLVVLELSTA